MTDPVTLTAASIMAIAASKFVGKAAEKAGETVAPAVLQGAGKQVDKLWSRIKQHFSGNKRAETAIVQVEQEQSEEALSTLAGYLDYEMGAPEHETFVQELQQMAQQIINVDIGEQNWSEKQIHNTFHTEANDNSKVTNIAELNARDVQL